MDLAKGAFEIKQRYNKRTLFCTGFDDNIRHHRGMLYIVPEIFDVKPFEFEIRYSYFALGNRTCYHEDRM